MLLLVVAVVGAGLTGLVRVPGVPTLAAFSPAASPSTPEPSATSTGVESADPGSATGEPATAADRTGDVAQAPPAAAIQPVHEQSLAIGSFRDLPAALERASRISGMEGLLVVVAPVEVDGGEWHRLLVGPVPDSGGADGLRRAVAERLAVSATDDWMVRRTPLAFELGTAPALDEALERVRSLVDRDVPAYVLETSNGRTSFRIYAGAYADEEEAVHMADVLREAGLGDAPLVPRRGRVVSGSGVGSS